MNLSTNHAQQRPMPDEPVRTDKLLSLLGGNVRFELIRHLAAGPQSVSSLAEKLDQSIGLVSHNLRLLRQHQLVAVKPNARQRIYSLSPSIRCEPCENRVRLVFTLPSMDKVALDIPLPADSTSSDPVPSIQVPRTNMDRMKKPSG
ncbi:MAG: helix-turn-helix domain-containing protein [Planctomycetota bacterium]|nr:helix-turn-helix domain-containing protein [Planctomycetota bacterium]